MGLILIPTAAVLIKLNEPPQKPCSSLYILAYVQLLLSVCERIINFAIC
jgi:hypothetical protein